MKGRDFAGASLRDTIDWVFPSSYMELGPIWTTERFLLERILYPLSGTGHGAHKAFSGCLFERILRKAGQACMIYLGKIQ